MIFDQVAGKHHFGIRHPGDDIAGGMSGAERHQPHLAFAEIDRHVGFECQRRPGQARNALGILEQTREAAIFGIPILLAALLEQTDGIAGPLLTAVGADPIAITDNLNFGNPERPEIMGQIVRAIEGMAEACRALDFPVVSGNVSLYNETNGRAILPTPSIACSNSSSPW